MIGHPRKLALRFVPFVLVAAALTACQSPFRAADGVGRDAYTESVLARSVSQAMRPQGGVMPSSTYYGGVSPVVRIDQATTTAASTQPEDPILEQLRLHPSIPNAKQLGLEAARLNADEPVVGLTLQDAIARAARHSVAIKVEAYNPAIRSAQIIEAESAFDPVIFGQSQWTNTDTPQISPSFSNGQTWQNQLGVRRVLPSGTQVQASAGWTYRDITTPEGSLALPNKTTWAANLNLQITQPLLRGFGADVTQANIYLAQRDMRLSLAQFKGQVISTVADVEEAYQTLLQAKTNVEVLSRLLVTGQQTYNTIVDRAFDVTKAARGQAEAALENRKADFLRAQRDLRNASDRLKALINDPEISIYSNILINPIDRPMEDPVAFNVQDCIEMALRQRPEMQQARIQVERANIVVTVARNDLLPRLDLTAGVTTNGLDGGLDQAFTTTVNPMHSIDWSAGIRLEFPIGNRGPEAILERRKLEQRQALDNIIAIAQTIVQDVKLQLHDVMFSFEEMAFRKRARVAAAMELEGIIEIEEIRPRTPEFLQLKLDSQARLANAEQALIQSVINYNLAIMRLERAKGTLLEYNQVSLDRPPPVVEDNQELNRYMRFWGSTKVLKD